MIKSRFSFLCYVLIVVALAITAGGIALFRFKVRSEDVGPPYVFAVFIAAVGLGLLYYRLKRTTRLTITQDGIILRNIFFRKEVLSEQIASIEIFARKISWPVDTKTESVAIGLKTGETYFLVDADYRNMTELRRLLRDQYADKLINSLPVKQVLHRLTMTAEDHMQTEDFSANLLTSGTWWLFWLFEIMAVAMLASFLFQRQASGFQTLPVLLLFMPFIYWITGGHLFYLRISAREVIVCNHLFYWYRRVYPIEDIQAVVLEMGYRNSKYLRIRTNDLRSVRFHPDSFRKKHWLALVEKFRNLGIPVVDELEW